MFKQSVTQAVQENHFSIINKFAFRMLGDIILLNHAFRISGDHDGMVDCDNWQGQLMCPFVRGIVTMTFSTVKLSFGTEETK